MEMCIISGVAAQVRSLGGEAGSARSPPSSPPCWPLAPALLVTLEAQHSLACHRPDALLPHVLHKIYVVPWGQPHLEAWRGLLGQPPFLGGRAKTKTSSSFVPLPGAETSHHQAGEDRGTAAGPGLPLRLLVDVLSTTTTSLQPGSICWVWISMALVCKPKAGLRPCPKLSLARAWQGDHDLSSR